jgi:hypothetical protein
MQVCYTPVSSSGETALVLRVRFFSSTEEQLHTYLLIYNMIGICVFLQPCLLRVRWAMSCSVLVAVATPSDSVFITHTAVSKLSMFMPTNHLSLPPDPAEGALCLVDEACESSIHEVVICMTEANKVTLSYIPLTECRLG